MIDFLRKNKVVLLFAVGTLLAEGVHHLNFLQNIHSYASYEVECENINIPVTWDSVLYYFLSQLCKASLFGAILSYKYAVVSKLDSSKPIAFSLIVACSLWQLDELLYLLNIDSSVLYPKSLEVKLVFVCAVMVVTFVLFKLSQSWRMSRRL